MSHCCRRGDAACRLAVCAVLTALAAVLSSVPLCAQARQKAKPFSASDTVYMPRAQRRLARFPAGTPSQQDNLAPGAIRGVFSVYDDAERCTPSAIAPATQTRLVPPAQALVAKGFWLGNTVREYALEMTLSLGALRDHLRSNGDAIAARRHVCVGMADFSPKGPNARSYPAGYVMVDPRVLAFIQSQHPGSPLRGSENMFLAHEFAHQVQFWSSRSSPSRACGGWNWLPIVWPVRSSARLRRVPGRHSAHLMPPRMGSSRTRLAHWRIRRISLVMTT